MYSSLLGAPLGAGAGNRIQENLSSWFTKLHQGGPQPGPVSQVPFLGSSPDMLWAGSLARGFSHAHEPCAWAPSPASTTNLDSQGSRQVILPPRASVSSSGHPDLSYGIMRQVKYWVFGWETALTHREPCEDRMTGEQWQQPVSPALIQNQPEAQVWRMEKKLPFLTGRVDTGLIQSSCSWHPWQWPCPGPGNGSLGGKWLWPSENAYSLWT
jgi:hypothetical protein